MSEKSVLEQYTKALKALLIHKDTVAAQTAAEAAIKLNGDFAPAWSILARTTRYPASAARYAERAYSLDKSNRYYLEQLANALVQATNYEEAVPILKELVAKSPKPQYYYTLAYLLYNINKGEEAVAVLDSAAVQIGRNPALGRLRQLLLLTQGRVLEAEADAKKSIEEAPYLADNHIALANIYVQTRRDSLAIVSFQNAIAIDTLAVEPWLALAEYHNKKNHKALYLSVLARLFANDRFPLEDKLEEWKTLSSDIDSYRKFFTYYDTLIKQLYILEPNNRDVVQQYIQHLLRSGMPEEAARLSKRFLKTDSPTIDDFESVLAIESILERPDSVYHYINLALKHHPKNVRLLAMRAAYAGERKEYDSAIKDFNRAIEYAEDNEMRGELYLRIGLVEHERNNMKACYNAFDMAIKLNRDNDTLRGRYYATLGDIEHQRNNMKACYKAYDKSLKCFADNATVLNNYAYFLSLEERDLERALQMINRALEIGEKSATNLDTKAWVLYKLGRHKEAKKIMQQAISLDDSKDATFALHYGDILHALGEDFMAKIYWRKALEQGADKKEIEKRFLPENSNPKK